MSRLEETTTHDDGTCSDPGSAVAMRARSLLPLAGVAVVATACGSSSTQPGPQSPGAAAAQPCGSAGAGAMTVATARYVMSLVTGPVEAMLSQAEIDAQHPTSGELMLRGEMALQPGGHGSGGMTMSGTDTGGMNHGGSGASASGDVRHLEVHICTRSGSVVSDASPAIRIQDTTLHSGTVDVPVAVMQGVTAGPSDLHYGNNVMLTPGHSYTVDVELVGEKATFQVAAS